MSQPRYEQVREIKSTGHYIFIPIPIPIPIPRPRIEKIRFNLQCEAPHKLGAAVGGHIRFNLHAYMYVYKM